MLTVANGLAARGHRIDVVFGAGGDELDDLVSPAVERIELVTGRVRSMTWPLTAAIRRRQPDCLVTTMSHANAIGLVAARLSRTRVPVVVRFANVPAGRPGGREAVRHVRWRLTRRLRLGAASMVTPSVALAQTVRETFGPGHDPVVIPNPVIGDDFAVRAAAPVAHRWFEDGSRVVLAVGRLHAQKGFDLLLEAFAQINRAAPDTRLLILGEGHERARLEAERGRLGLDEVAELPGFVPDPVPYMARSEVFVLSSRNEGLPSALIEALAAGTRVVAADCAHGPAEILEGGRYGCLVRPGDVGALACAVLAALDEPRSAPPDEAWLRYSERSAVDSYEVLLANVAGRR